MKDKKPDLDQIAKTLGVESAGTVTAGAGYFGALQLVEDVRELEHVGWDWHCPVCEAVFNDVRMTKQAARMHLQACRKRSEADREVFRRTFRWPRH